MIDPTTLASLGPSGEKTAEASTQALEALVRRARHRLLILRALAWGGAGLAGGALTGLITAASLGAHPTPWIRDLGLVVGAAALLAGPLAALGRARLTDAEVARALTSNDSRLRSILLSAIELRQLPPALGLSTNLIRAQAVFAAARLQEIDPQRELPDQAARGSLALGILSMLALAAAVAKGPDGLHRGFLALRTAPVAAPHATAREPITGDIELMLVYPAHTRLAPRTITGTSGEIEAPAGTTVRLRTRADRPVREAAMIVNGETVPLTVHNERQLAGTFTVTKAGSYSFRFGSAKHPEAEGPPISIAVVADAPPQITLSSPPETLEVDPHQVLTLLYQVSDDYGISDVRLVYRLPGAEADQSVPLKQLEDPPLRIEGSARFDLAQLHLLSGDELSYFIEAHDNDSIQGAKAGRSRPHHLKVYSEVEHHREILAQARALWERLLLVLADRLDEGTSETPPTAGEAADTRALLLAQEMAREAVKLRKDKQLSTALLNTAHGERRRASLTADARESLTIYLRASRAPNRSALATFRRVLGDETEGLERDTLYLEALLDQATKDDLRTLSKELAERRRELSDLIERYRKHPTPEGKAEIQALLARLRSRMGELFGRMQELAKSISDQHLNREALAALSKDKNLAGNLSKTDDALRNGDLDGALKSLDQLAQSLDSLQNRLEQAKGRQAQAYPGLAKKISEFKEKLEEVQKQEQGIVERTQAIQHEARKAAIDRAPASPQLLDQLRADAERARAQLGQIPDGAAGRAVSNDDLTLARDRTDQLARALQAVDLDEARQSVRDAREATERMQNGLSALPFLSDPFSPDSFGRNQPPSPARDEAKSHLAQVEPLLHSIQSQLEKLFPDEKTLLGPKQQQQLGQLQRDQQKAQDGAKRLQQQLEQIGQQAPVFDPEAAEALEQAGQRMDGAQEQLSRREPGRAGEEERGAVEQLRRLTQSMQKGAGKPGESGLPNPFALSTPSDDSNGEGGDDATEHEKVVVPGADQYQVPAEFRRDILDAMKQKAPASFEDQVKHYYREIVK